VVNLGFFRVVYSQQLQEFFELCRIHFCAGSGEVKTRLASTALRATRLYFAVSLASRFTVVSDLPRFKFKTFHLTGDVLLLRKLRNKNGSYLRNTIDHLAPNNNQLSSNLQNDASLAFPY
jgi:hypothetical protein